MSRTASQLRTQARRLDRVNLQMANLVRIMRDEAALYLQFRARGRLWRLTNGRHVAETIALRVTTNPQVIPVGDALLHSSSRGPSWCKETHARLPDSVAFYDLVAGGIATAMKCRSRCSRAWLSGSCCGGPRREPPRARTAHANLHLEGGRPCEGQRLRWPLSQSRRGADSHERSEA
jgi:hypothetical protein